MQHWLAEWFAELYQSYPLELGNLNCHIKWLIKATEEFIVYVMYNEFHSLPLPIAHLGWCGL